MPPAHAAHVGPALRQRRGLRFLYPRRPTGAPDPGPAASTIGRDTARISLLGTGVLGRLIFALIGTLRRGGLLWRFNFTVHGVLAGRRVRVPLLFGHGFQNLALPEPWFLGALHSILRVRPGAFLDVGVNLGQTLLKVKALDPEREYIGFEPNPLCVQYVQLLITSNRFGRSTVIPSGLGAAPAVVRLFSKAAADPSASVVAGFRQPDRYSSSQCVTVLEGDAVVDGLGLQDVGIVKVDVEGAELDVLRGLRKTLVRCAPYVFCEILPVFDEGTDLGQFRRRRQVELETLMAETGFLLFRLLSDRSGQRIEQIESHADLSRSNYVFVPVALVPQFTQLFPQCSMPG